MKGAISMRQFLRDNSLTLTLFAFFLAFWVGQSITGFQVYNDDQREHHEQTISFVQYLGTGHFWEATAENWESEFLQMGAYIALTAFLFQRGSSQSKAPPEDGQDEEVDKNPEEERVKPDAPWAVRHGGIALKLYEYSLTITLLAIFLLCFIIHFVSGAMEHNQEQLAHGAAQIFVWQFLLTPQFWFQSLQNWQSEFLAVAALATLSIFLRQRGSPESKPVASPHAKTGSA
jgi:hypothetical protein